MKTYQNTALINAIQWQMGVVLPRANQVDFNRTDMSRGTFPPHTLVTVNGRYEVMFEGYYLLYNEEHGNPVAVVDQQGFERTHISCAVKQLVLTQEA